MQLFPHQALFFRTTLQLTYAVDIYVDRLTYTILENAFCPEKCFDTFPSCLLFFHMPPSTVAREKQHRYRTYKTSRKD
jgi:hypothetical protein